MVIGRERHITVVMTKRFKYRLSWKDLATGEEGHGEWLEEKSQLEQKAQEGNQQPGVYYWIEEQEA